MNLTEDQIKRLQEKLCEIGINNGIATYFAIRLGLPKGLEYKNDVASDLLQHLESTIKIADVCMSILFSEES